MGLFDKFKKNKSEPKAEPSKPTVKTNEVQSPVNKQPQIINDDSFDIDVIREFREARKESFAENLISSIMEYGEDSGSEEPMKITLTGEEAERVIERFSEIVEEENEKSGYKVGQLHKHQLYISQNNGRAIQALKDGDMQGATAYFEKNVEALDYTTISYSYLVDIYRYNEDYENELRICDSALDSLYSSARREDFVPRREEVAQRLNGGGFYSHDEELFKIVKREERMIVLNHLISNYYMTPQYKETNRLMGEAKKWYLENRPTNFLIYGTKVFNRSWCLLYKEHEEVRDLISLAGEAKYYEDNGDYEKALAVYEKALARDMELYPHKPTSQITKRIEVCQNKIRKQQIKDLEAKAKSLEKEDPVKAIDLYNELNILNPNLKKYDKRIEILSKKIEK